MMTVTEAGSKYTLNTQHSTLIRGTKWWLTLQNIFRANVICQCSGVVGGRLLIYVATNACVTVVGR